MTQVIQSHPIRKPQQHNVLTSHAPTCAERIHSLVAALQISRLADHTDLLLKVQQRRDDR